MDPGRPDAPGAGHRRGRGGGDHPEEQVCLERVEVGDVEDERARVRTEPEVRGVAEREEPGRPVHEVESQAGDAQDQGVAQLDQGVGRQEGGHRDESEGRQARPEHSSGRTRGGAGGGVGGPVGPRRLGRHRYPAPVSTIGWARIQRLTMV